MQVTFVLDLKYEPQFNWTLLLMAWIILIRWYDNLEIETLKRTHKIQSNTILRNTNIINLRDKFIQLSVEGHTEVARITNDGKDIRSVYYERIPCNTKYRWYRINLKEHEASY